MDCLGMSSVKQESNPYGDNEMHVKQEKKPIFPLVNVKEEPCEREMNCVWLKAENTSDLMNDSCYLTMANNIGDMKTGTKKVKIELDKLEDGKEVQIFNENPVWKSDCEKLTIVTVKKEIDDGEISEPDADFGLEHHPTMLGYKSQISNGDTAINQFTFNYDTGLHDLEIKVGRNYDGAEDDILSIKESEQEKCDNFRSSQSNQQSTNMCKPDNNELHKRTLKCVFCAYETKYKSYLSQHINSKHAVNSELFKCKDCTFETTYKSNLNKHIKRKHNVLSESHKCNECRYETKYICNLNGHIKRRHNLNCESHKCKDCMYETTYKFNLDKHIKRKHDVHTELYKCKDCTYETNHKFNLNEHIKRRHKVNSESSKCSNYTSEINLASHSDINKDVNSDLNKSKECTFVTEYEYHMNPNFEITNETSTLYKCKDCTFETRNYTTILLHIRTTSHMTTEVW